MTEIGARLHHVQLLSPEPEKSARFYGRLYGMRVEQAGGLWTCAAPERHLAFAAGRANRLGHAAYAFRDAHSFSEYRQKVEARTGVEDAESPFFEGSAFAVTDPQGNRIVFGVARPDIEPQDPKLVARLQHIGLRSTEPAALVPFYRDVLGFVVSDRVQDPTGRLRACFLRTDTEHHALALFDAPEVRHDHLSFETTDFLAVRDWADRISAMGSPLVWGIGRHGPGNDTFFMVHDPDGNLSEISAELEVCQPGRPEGQWPHEQRTLNVWGLAIMRS